ncbi:unnamed protein product [Sphagnum troendelagicum]|uniref:Uncharacterized protein n=1 Tax=Sphagnum troendelagicum TaxID=128251 RepID=A0ABP0V2C5_9BRYO
MLDDEAATVEQLRRGALRRAEDLGRDPPEVLLEQPNGMCKSDRANQQCQLVRSEGSIRSGDERLKSIPICDLFHRIALDSAGPLPETKTGNKCGIQTSTKVSPFMIFTGRTPRLRADNHLDALTSEVDDNASVEVTAVRFLKKVQLIASIHKNVLLNVEQAQKKQKNTYANRPGKHLFEGLVAGESMVKMKKPGKRRALIASWEGPYQFVGHADGKGNFDFEEGCRICIV